MKETNVSSPETLETMKYSRREFLKLTAAGGAFFLSWPAWAGPEAAPGEWWFVHVSDTHSGGAERAKTLAEVFADIREKFPQARFTLNTGDVSEHGWEEELDEYLQAIPILPHPHFAVMGNHDSRWSRAGRYAFRNRFQATRWAIEHEDLAVYALDCSVLVEQYGHLDPRELAWVKERLEKRKGKAAMLAFHHPPCDIKRFLDTDGALFDLIASHNVVAILGGHIHQLKHYQVNGTWIITSGAVMTPRSGYCVFRVRPGEVTLFERRPVEASTRETLTIPFSALQRGAAKVSQVRLKPRVRGAQGQIALPEGFDPAQCILQVNGHKTDCTFQTSGRRKYAQLGVEALPCGHHEVEIITPGLEDKHQKRAWGRLSIAPGSDIRLAWEKNLPSGVQSRPAFWKEWLIVSSNDGRVRAFETRSGKRRWEISTGPDELLSSPVVRGDRIYFGTIDEHLWCLSARDGSTLWKQPVEGSVIATGTFTENPAGFVVGTGKGRLYAVKPETGQTEWVFTIGNLIKATPAYDGKRLYFGAWDGNFYAVDAKSGQEAWQLRINTPHLSPATCNPKILDDNVIVVSHDYATHCLDAATGRRRWRWPAEGVEFQWNSPILDRCKPSYSSPVFYRGVAYLGSITGHLVGFDVATGQQVFELEVDDPIFDSFPLLVGNRLYFGTIGGALYAVDLDSGKVAWQYQLGSHFIFAPPESNGTHLAIGDLGGALACFEIA